MTTKAKAKAPKKTAAKPKAKAKSPGNPKTTIFDYKGRVGIISGTKLLNDPSKPGQLGTIVELENVSISPGAFEIMGKVRKSNDAIGDVMCWKAGDKRCFGFMGYVKYLLPKDATADRDYTPALLKSRIDKSVTAPDDFKKVVDTRG